MHIILYGSLKKKMKMNSLHKIDIHEKIDELNSQYQTAKALIIQFHDG